MQTMIRSGPLEEILKVREGFVRTPNNGKIEPVSAAARSKLGNPINAGLGDESGLYTATNKLLRRGRRCAAASPAWAAGPSR
jgi:hypothetical protein